MADTLSTLIRWLRRHVEALRRAELEALPGDRCLDDERLARAADGVAGPETIAHLASCPACRASLVDLRRLLDSPDVVRERERIAPPGPAVWRWPAWSVGAAAAALALVMLWVSAPHSSRMPDRLRDHPVGAPEEGPGQVSPRDQVSGPPTFEWTSVVGASAYRLTVFDSEGALVWTTETPDTAVVAQPGEVALSRDVEYWWRVEARVDFDRWVSSDLASFELR